MTDLTPITQAERTAKYLGDDPEQSRLWDERYLLFVKNLTAVFDGFKAVDIKALGVEHNELRVIIGPNGAGKTTFCDLVSGKTPPATGKVFYDGDEITHVQEVDIARRGIFALIGNRAFEMAMRKIRDGDTVEWEKLNLRGWRKWLVYNSFYTLEMAKKGIWDHW